MNKRPLYVTIIAWLYILTGVAWFAYRSPEIKGFDEDLVWSGLTCLAAIVCGIYMLRSQNWARWLALAWMAFHVILSLFHALPQLALHAVFLAILAFFLFRPAATRYFRAT